MLVTVGLNRLTRSSGILVSKTFIREINYEPRVNSGGGGSRREERGPLPSSLSVRLRSPVPLSLDLLEKLL